MCGIPLKNGGDIIEALAPLFAPIANARVGRKFVAADFAKAMQDDYGIYMHPYVAEDWAPRLADGGILEPVNSSTSYAEFIYRYTEIGDVADYLKSSEQIFEAFRIYVRPLLLRLEREIPSDADLNEMLFERIKGMAFEDILNKPDVIAIKTRTLMLSALEEEQEENPEAREMREMMDVAVATFIIEIEEGGSPLSKQPSDIALGALAAEVVLNFRVPPKRGDSFQGKTIYLDTPLVLDLIDLGTREEVEYARSLVADLRAQGASIAIFSHCLDEFSSIIKATLDNVGKPDGLSGALGARFRIDADAVIAARQAIRNPTAVLKTYGVGVFQSDTHDQLKHFSKEHEKDVLAKIRPFSLQKIEAREVDASSVSAMIRYVLARRPRGGVMNHEKLFVTKNVQLAKTASRILPQFVYGVDDSDPPILTDRFIGGILWLAKGGEGASIPHSKLVANCAAAVRPRKDVMKAARETLSRLDPRKAAEFEALMSDGRCNLYLMKGTLGSAQLITENNAASLYEEVRRQTAAEIEEQGRLALAAAKNEYDQKVKALSHTKDQALNDTQSALQKIEELNQSNSALHAHFMREQEARMNTELIIVNQCVKATRPVIWLLVIAVSFVIALVGLLLSQIDTTDYLGFFKYVLIAVAMGAVTYFDVPQRMFGSWVERKRSQWLFRLLGRRGLGRYYDKLNVDWGKDVAT